MKLSNYYFFAMALLLLSSCATLLGPRKKEMKIITNSSGRVIVGKDTLIPVQLNVYRIDAERRKEPLEVTVYNDSLIKKVSIESRNSLGYAFNLYTFGIGFLINKNSPKRYTYPRKVFIDLEKKDSTYKIYAPRKNNLTPYGTILKIAPLKIISDDFPCIEISLEKKTNGYFSTQVMGAYSLPKSAFFTTILNPKYNGYRFAIEEKVYFKNTAPAGPYIGFELDYKKENFTTNRSFRVGELTDSTHIEYDEAFRVHKKTISLNAKAGYQHIIRKRLTIDAYLGVGARYRDVEHLYFSNHVPESMEIPEKGFFLENILSEKGKGGAIALQLSVRLGWAF